MICVVKTYPVVIFELSFLKNWIKILSTRLLLIDIHQKHFEDSSQFSSIIYRGNTTETKGTAFVVYEDIFDAKNACDHLSGFNVCNRYLVVLYFQPNKVMSYCLIFPFDHNWKSSYSCGFPPILQWKKFKMNTLETDANQMRKWCVYCVL